MGFGIQPPLVFVFTEKDGLNRRYRYQFVCVCLYVTAEMVLLISCVHFYVKLCCKLITIIFASKGGMATRCLALLHLHPFGCQFYLILLKT